MTKKLRLVIFLLITAFLAVAFALNIIYVRGVIKDRAFSEWRQHNDTNTERLKSYLNQIKYITLAFASNEIYFQYLLSRSVKLESDIKSLFKEAVTDDSLIQAMRIVSADGDILIYVKGSETLTKDNGYINISTKEYFQLLGTIESREPLFSNIERALTPGDTEFGPPLIRVLYPIYSDDEKLGYLLINFDTSVLNDILYAGGENEPYSFIAAYSPEYAGLFLFHQKNREYEFASQLGSDYFVSTVYPPELDRALQNNKSGITEIYKGFAVFNTIVPTNYSESEWKIVSVVPEYGSPISFREFVNDKFLVSVLIFIIVLWVVMPFYISRNTVSPVNELRTGIQKIGGGDFGFRFDISRFPAELQPVAETVNRMTESITKYIAEIEDDHKKIELLHKMQTMGLIAGGIAHELNSPLNSILLACDLLERVLQGRHKEDVILIAEEAKRCVGIIASLRAMAPKNRDSMAFVKINLKEVVRAAIPDNIIGVSKECYDADIAGDAVLLSVMVKNLYRNAVDATPDIGRHIVFRTYAKDGRVFLEAEDNGCGISPDILSQFPLPFMSKKKTGANMGIGVCLIYKIATEHGGKVSIVSELEKGTKITIEFGIYVENNAS